MYVDPFGPSWWWRRWIWGIRADIWIKNGGISEKLIKAGQATRIDPQSLPPVGDIAGGITQMAQAEKPRHLRSSRSSFRAVSGSPTCTTWETCTR